MNLNFKFLKIITIICFICIGTKSQAEDELWRQIPLRSEVQKKFGVMGGEGLQQIMGISFAYSNPKIIYLVSDTSQVWKSIDGGNSWQMKHKGFLSNGGIAVSVDPINENVAFVAGSVCESSRPRYSPADGIYRTIDGGNNWKLVKPALFAKVRGGSLFAFDPVNNENKRTKTIYAGTHKDGLLISRDGGDNWKEVLGFKGDIILDLKINPLDPSNLFLLTDKGLYKVVIENYTISQIEKLGIDLPA